MKLTAKLDGTEHRLDIRRDGANVAAEIDGRRYTLAARETEAGVYLLTFEGRVYECRVERAGDAEQRSSGSACRVGVRNRVYEISLSDPKRLRGAGGAGADASGRAEIRAPMPGKVVRVLVEAGASVEAGAGLVVVEAMKMQNEMKSPRAGTVTELHARAGDTVQAGDVLVVVE
jgi:biotin carboxyl carrier protein